VKTNKHRYRPLKTKPKPGIRTENIEIKETIWSIVIRMWNFDEQVVGRCRILAGELCILKGLTGNPANSIKHIIIPKTMALRSCKDVNAYTSSSA
jgi:hypothetical protein